MTSESHLSSFSKPTVTASSPALLSDLTPGNLNTADNAFPEHILADPVLIPMGSVTGDATNFEMDDNVTARPRSATMEESSPRQSRHQRNTAYRHAIKRSLSMNDLKRPAISLIRAPPPSPEGRLPTPKLLGIDEFEDIFSLCGLS